MYGKLFEAMYTGSMRGSGPVVFALWPYVIAHQKPNHDRSIFTVELNPEIISFYIGKVTPDEVSEVIEAMCQPDLRSRTEDEGGRKLIREGQFLYRVVNGAKYDKIRRECDRRQSNRARKQQQRQREKEKVESNEETEKADRYHPDTRTALHWLNQEAGRHFRELDSSLEPISARLNEDGVDIEGVKMMITRQCKRWKGTAQEDYLRPTTLFGKEKFDGYYTARDLPIQTNDKPEKTLRDKELDRYLRMAENI